MIRLMSIAGLVEHQQQLGEAFKPALLRGFRAGAKRCIPALIRSTREAPPANPGGVGTGGAVSSGTFARSWKSSGLPNGARVYNTAPYGAIVEYGRRPGARMPPVDTIAKWVQRKLSAGTTAGGRPRRMGAKDARAAAYVIARAIAKRGLLPRRVMGRALPEIATLVMIEVLHELDRALGVA